MASASCPYAIVPHYRSPDHPESAACDQVAARYAAAGIPHRTLRDGQALVINGADVGELGGLLPAQSRCAPLADVGQADIARYYSRGFTECDGPVAVRRRMADAGCHAE